MAFATSPCRAASVTLVGGAELSEEVEHRLRERARATVRAPGRRGAPEDRHDLRLMEDRAVVIAHVLRAPVPRPRGLTAVREHLHVLPVQIPDALGHRRGGHET